jgi:hypothetical protein
VLLEPLSAVLCSNASNQFKEKTKSFFIVILLLPTSCSICQRWRALSPEWAAALQPPFFQSYVLLR